MPLAETPFFSVAAFVGATAGDMLAACMAALPPTGGVCDARGLTSGGTISSIVLNASGVKVLWPCATFVVTGSIKVNNTGGQVSGVNWDACAASYANVGTQFRWAGNATDPLLDLKGVRDSKFKDFSIVSDVTAPLAEAIRLETAAGSVSTRRMFDNILINGTRQGGLIKGFRWCTGFDCSDGVVLGNNDLDDLRNVVVANYTNCAYSIEGTQSKTHTFTKSAFAGQPAYSQRGVCTTQGADPSTNAGSFQWFGAAGGGGNAVADFDLGAPTDSILIEGCNFESSNRLLQTNSAGSAQWPIVITGCRWAADNLSADNNVILYQFRGPLILNGNIVQLPSGAIRSPQFNISTSGSPARGVAIGNSITWNLAASGSNPFVTSGSGSFWTTLGNLIQDNSGNAFAIPDTLQQQVAPQ
jgi:hypothetical protein